MAAEGRFALRDRDELRHKLKHCQDTLDQYLTTIQQLREENEILTKSLEQWRNAAPGEMEA
jgi:hypothetical protein